MEGNKILIIMGFIVLLIFGIIGSLFFIPISNDVQDITVDLIVYQPPLGDVEIREVSATAHPKTLLSLGSVTDVFELAGDILDGDDFTIEITCAGKTETKEFNAITRTEEISTTMKITNIPIEEKVVTVELLSHGNTVDVKEIAIE